MPSIGSAAGAVDAGDLGRVLMLEHAFVVSTEIRSPRIAGQMDLSRARADPRPGRSGGQSVTTALPQVLRSARSWRACAAWSKGYGG